MEFKSKNPLLRHHLLAVKATTAIVDDATMTIRGTVAKSFFLLTLLAMAGIWGWSNVVVGKIALAEQLIRIGFILSLLCAVILCFKPQWAVLLAPLYALGKGVVMGSISAVVDPSVGGIVSQAILLTFATLVGMLTLYSMGLIQITSRLQTWFMTALAATALVYLLGLLLMWRGTSLPYLHESSWIGIGFSVGVVCLAAFSLLLDFEHIVQSQRAGAPKYFEWYAAHSLVVSLLWLYIEILDLLSKLRKKQD